MRHQSPLALPPPAGAAHWSEDLLFHGRFLDALSQLNTAFLSLLGELHATRPGMPALGLPGHLVAALARSQPGPAPLHLPYALFDLRFREERFWRLEAAAAQAVRDAESAAAADARLLRFVRAALPLAWHLAQVDPRVARLSLGLAEPTGETLAALPPGALEVLARRTAGWLSARFCTRERFWNLLAGALRFPPDGNHLERLKLLGLQLQGTESARQQQLHRRLRPSTHA